MLKRHADPREEQERLRLLFEYLRGVFSADAHREVLLPQLTDYILGNCVMRSGGLVNGRSLFGGPFQGRRAAIVQAGSFGQAMFERLRASDYCEVVGWYDEDYWEYRRCGMDVDPLESIRGADFDYALIAKIEPAAIGRLRSELEALGVPREKILCADCPRERREAILKEYLA